MALENNFLYTGIIVDSYSEVKKEQEVKPRKKIYKDLKQLLHECSLVGSTKYGNNFIM